MLQSRRVLAANSRRMNRVGFAHLLFVGFLAAAIACPATAFTSDYGPAAAVAAIRHDLPLLLAAPLQDTHLKPTIDWVVADSQDAVAMWHAGQNRGVVALRFRSGRWWWRGAAVMTAGEVGVWTPMSIPGNRITLCYHYGLMPGAPSAHDLLAQGFIDKALADELSGRLTAAASFSSTEPRPVVLCDPDLTHYIESASSNVYVATLFHKDDVEWQWFSLSGYTPSTWQKAAIPGTDPYYLFSLKVESFAGEAPPPAALAFASGSSFEVWFPFVLPRNKSYMLHLSNVDPAIAELSGTLKNNVVRFVLPPFTLRSGVIAHGEIDGASY